MNVENQLFLHFFNWLIFWIWFHYYSKKKQNGFNIWLSGFMMIYSFIFMNMWI
jgi:hypothetical protein